ncbi:MAG: 2-hydroxychromene-2-carboxylate isomerase [Gammaproteobacteria bacterium]|nr:2-hydroxychromene-2-carboxylate isomerase [Gammaproteobacteria bacterium]MBT5202818.1 2-hydroxychromene-2-carboxylate isomerase [Gammaproteobacteria bacterium]MBT5600681.1 2-hydroxychromene-2-carboxylate isomerase [Gammaproteobacteria bacterium]MBT6244158.1 2-hydroxychromene-2-carboxylate isomerase [Gammaproteobacteria bacterium]
MSIVKGRGVLQVYIDFKSPYAFVALRPCWQLERDYGIAIEWLPLTLNIGSYLGTAKVDDTGKVTSNNRSPRQWQAVRYAYMDARRYADSQGLLLKGTQKIWDSSIAAIGLLWATDHARNRAALRDYTTMVFDRFWQRQLDIENAAVIAAVLEEAGISASGFSDYLAGPGRYHHDQLQEQILQAGCFGVPTFCINSETYFGRENLPIVRWHLEGEPGRIPHKAYDTVLS